MKWSFVGLFCLVATVCLMASPLPAAAQARGAQPVEVDRIVAVVNDEVITSRELRLRLAQIEQQLKKQKTPLPPGDLLARQVLERLIVDKVQLQFARENSVRVDDIQLERALMRVAENNRMSLADFRKALEKDGISWMNFREDIRNEITVARLREREVDSRIVVSEGEIDNYLANPAAMAQATEEFLVHHILVRIPEQAAPDQLQRLRARADEALAQLKRGADFGQVAASYSEAPDALSGASLGWRSAERLPGLFAEALAKMKPGELSDILRSPGGLHILKLADRRGGIGAGQRLQQTHARHILIKVSELVSENEARHKLLVLKERLDNKADFGELAKLHSNDLSATKGGDLGWLYPGDTVPEFERAMDGLKIGEVSEPVRSPFGWHLIQVLERRVEDVSQERQRQLARQALRERKSDEAYEDWLRQLRDRAYVEYRFEDR
jgi:peptidyl-prolyl cis-trans isomerase SurA